MPGDKATFEQAAIAAETGEPLVVKCSTTLEAILVVHGYVAHGIARPAVETLTSSRR